MSDPQNPYGFRYFDRPTDYRDDEEGELEDYEEKSCPSNCCDVDCECDDCIRCAKSGVAREESYSDSAVAA